MQNDIPFDLVYLHAVYFIHAVARRELDNAEFEMELRNIKNTLLNHFDTLDQILAQIWSDGNLLHENGYTINDKNEIRSLAREYLDYVSINYEMDRAEILEIFSEIEFENVLVGFRQHIEAIIQIENSSIEILRRIVPYLYEIKKRTCRISSLSEAFIQAIYKDSLKKKFYKALLVGVAVAATGASIAAGVAAGNKIAYQRTKS